MQKRIKGLLALLLLICTTTTVFAQNVTVQGTVTDTMNEPLIGVNVQVKGTTIGVVTDIDGKYSLSVPGSQSVLVFSYVGYLPQEITVSNQRNITVIMRENVSQLDELVVVGYGTMRRSDLTGSTATVKDEVLSQRSATTLGQALGGKAAGVHVSTNSGRPGGRATMRIRGNTSISLSNEPLYVIDGVILNVASLQNGTSPIDYFNPNDIQSIEVLKDASATAIYGARGANGVVMITTKKGEGAGSTVRYDTNFSIGVLPKKLEVLNAEEFLRVEELAYANAQKYDPAGWARGAYTDPKLKRTNPRLFDSNGKPLHDTDWQKEATQNALSQSHQISVTSSKGGDNYGFSAGYLDDKGLIINSWLKRYSGRFFMDNQVNKWLKAGGSMTYNFQKERQHDTMNDGGISIGRQLVEELPIIPVRYEDGTFGGNNHYPGMEGGNSPVQLAYDRNRTLETQSMRGNIYADITFMEGLEFRTMVGTSVLNQKASYYGGRQLIWISSPNGSASISNNMNISWQFENYLTYRKVFALDHSFNGMAGVSWQHVSSANSSGSNSRFSDDFFQYNNLGAGTNPSVSSSASAYGLNSYFTRLNYAYKSKYLLTATARMDGSSKFGSSNRFAFFPSVGGAWRISEEDFIQSVDAVSNIKLRASHGLTGSSETGAYAWQGNLSNYTVVFGTTAANAIGVSNLPNPDLKWETTAQTNFGLDLGFFSRVNLELDVYYKKTTDMLLNAPLPRSSGYTTITKNIGSQRNKGLEITLNTININSRDFQWETTFNISFNKNKVLSLNEGGDDIFPGPDILTNTNNVIRVGEPVGSFYGYVRLGTWGTAEEAEAARYGKKPGDLKLWDKNNDGEINDNDKVIIGKGIPDGYGSFYNSFKYKNFDLIVDLQYMFGNDIMNISKHSAEDRTGAANSYKTVLNAWTPTNQNTMIAEIRPMGAGYTTNIDSHFIEDGSFLRGRNLVLGYTFSPELTRRLSLKYLRIYGSVQNFFLATNYSGYDPEVSDATQNFGQGITVFGYPRQRTFSIGLNVSF